MIRSLFLLLVVFCFSHRLSAQYCVANHQNTCAPSPTTQQNILDSIWSSTNMSVAIPGCWTNAPYYNLTGTNSTLGITEGTPFTFSVKAKMQSAVTLLLWIDLNRDQRWSVNEYFNIATVANAVGVFSNTIVVPIGSAGVPTKARLRLVRTAGVGNNPGLEACYMYFSGSTYDFDVVIVPAQACAGVPAKPVLNRTLPALCSYDTASIYSTTIYTGTGITYQWQTSTNGGTTWVAAPSTNNLTRYTVTGSNFSVPTYLRFQVTCSGSGSIASDSVLIQRKAVVNCPCLPQHAGTCQTDDLLRSVSTASGWRPTMPTQCTSNSVLYQWIGNTDTLNLIQGGRDSLLLSRGRNSVAAYLHIDYNKNGTFEAGESTSIVLAANLGTNFKTLFTVPNNALPGYTTGRIRVARAMSSTDGCGFLVEGQTYLFHVKVQPAQLCTQALPATIAAPQASICPNDSVRLTAVTASAERGRTNIWQWSTDGGTTWARFGGADTLDARFLSGLRLLAGPLQVRMMTTCANGGAVSFSNVLTFTKGTVAQCDCQPLHGGTCTSTELMTRFQRLSTSFNLTVPLSCSGNAAAFGPFTGATDTLYLQAGTVANLTYRNGGRAMDYSLWLDLDRDSMFTTLEWTDMGRNVAAGALRTVGISIPATAVNGTSKGRIRSRVAGSANGPSNMCSQFGAGYSYDFYIHVSGGTTSLPSLETSGLRLYPNPTTGRLSLKGLDAQTETEVHVLDLMGKAQTSPMLLPAGTDVFSIGAVPGLYMVKVIHGGKAYVQRVVVQ